MSLRGNPDWQLVFNNVQHKFTDGELRANISRIYEHNFHGWDPEAPLRGHCRVAWTGDVGDGCRYITNRMTREMSNDWWYSEFVRYYIMKRFEENLHIDTGIDEWAEHVFPPRYEGYEEEFEEESDDQEPSEWDVSDRELPYPRHHLELHHPESDDERTSV